MALFVFAIFAFSAGSFLVDSSSSPGSLIRRRNFVLVDFSGSMANYYTESETKQSDRCFGGC
jgi:hypothetical protein